MLPNLGGCCIAMFLFNPSGEQRHKATKEVKALLFGPIQAQKFKFLIQRTSCKCKPASVDKIVEFVLVTRFIVLLFVE